MKTPGSKLRYKLKLIGVKSYQFNKIRKNIEREFGKEMVGMCLKMWTNGVLFGARLK